jgi:hypothetical protein
MPAGAKPGERRGGRAKGQQNKATIEQALIAEQVLKRASMEGKKLGKEVLEEFMGIFAELAYHFKPAINNEPINEKSDENQFCKYAQLAVEAAAKLTPYQSPTFRAVVVAPAPEKPKDGIVKRFTVEIFDHNGRAPLKQLNGNSHQQIIEHQ